MVGSLSLCSQTLKTAIDAGDFEKSMNAIHALSSLICSSLSDILDDPNLPKTISQVAILVNALTNQTKVIQSGVLEMKRMSQKEEVDLEHPKIQKSFTFLIEVVFKALVEAGVNRTSLETFTNILSRELVDFESRLNVILRKTPIAMLDKVDNPLVRKALNRSGSANPAPDIVV